MKTTKQELEQRCARLERAIGPLELALADLALGQVVWFGRGVFRLGISRAIGAHGGIVIVNNDGNVSADYWEQFARNQLEHIAACITGENTEHNCELSARRNVIETAQAYVTGEQRQYKAA